MPFAGRVGPHPDRRTAQDPQGGYDAKRLLVRSLYASAGCSRAELREAIRLIDWKMKRKSEFTKYVDDESADWNK